jgi:hypothetical protein
MSRVYVSGPISGLPLREAQAAFGAACDTLHALGYSTLNPFDIAPWPGCACAAPAGDTAGAGGSHTWSCYVRSDLASMLRCDAIWMLPGWEASAGARLELSVAAAAGLQVLHPPLGAAP